MRIIVYVLITALLGFAFGYELYDGIHFTKAPCPATTTQASSVVPMDATDMTTVTKYAGSTTTVGPAEYSPGTPEEYDRLHGCDTLSRFDRSAGHEATKRCVSHELGIPLQDFN